MYKFQYGHARSTKAKYVDMINFYRVSVYTELLVIKLINRVTLKLWQMGKLPAKKVRKQY